MINHLKYFPIVRSNDFTLTLTSLNEDEKTSSGGIVEVSDKDVVRANEAPGAAGGPFSASKRACPIVATITRCTSTISFFL